MVIINCACNRNGATGNRARDLEAGGKRGRPTMFIVMVSFESLFYFCTIHVM